MDKRRAIQIMTKAAQLYKEHLEDQKVLFLYGLPKEVNRQLQESNKILSSVQGYEVAFHRYNFLHLTGVRLNKKETASFQQKSLLWFSCFILLKSAVFMVILNTGST